MIELIAFLCTADPECVAFNSEGELFHRGSTEIDPEIQLYLKSE